MIEALLAVFRDRSPAHLLRDVVDIALVAYAIYRMLLLLRGTRAMQVGVGLAFVVLVYLAAQRAGLATTFSLLDRLFGAFLLLVVVIFQADIRRALMRVGDRPFLFRWRKDAETSAVEEAIAASTMLAQRRIGALMVFERDASLEDFVHQGSVLDAAVSRELLYTTFLPAYENPLHDGAVIVRNARIWKAGAVLPLTANPGLDRTLGTRHRAALGISEETDAVVIVVSEERGQVSLCFNGNIVRGLDAQSLRQALYGLFYPKRRAAALLKAVQETPERTSVIPEPPVGRGSLPGRPDETWRTKARAAPRTTRTPAEGVARPASQKAVAAKEETATEGGDEPGARGAQS